MSVARATSVARPMTNENNLLYEKLNKDELLTNMVLFIPQFEWGL